MLRVGRAGWITLACAVLGWTCWLLTVLGAPPSLPGAQIAFYSSLWLALTASGAILLSVGARRREPRRLRSTAFFWPHTSLASFLILFALWLQALRMLTLPNLLLLLALFALLEGAYALANRRYWAE